MAVKYLTGRTFFQCSWTFDGDQINIMKGWKSNSALHVTSRLPPTVRAVSAERTVTMVDMLKYISSKQASCPVVPFRYNYCCMLKN